MQTNITVIGGNLTRDPELRYTPKGSPVCEFGIANNKKWKTDSGEQKEDVCFVSVVAWGSLAENIAKYRKKGDGILVEGRLKFEQWEKNGEKRSMIKVTAEKASWFFGGKEQAAEDIQDPTLRMDKLRGDAPQKNDLEDSEIPF